jgi:signal transduction histidine kinase
MIRKRGLIYGILVGLLVIMGIWWVYFLTSESSAHAEFRLQKLANDRLHAVFLIRSNPLIAADPQGRLGRQFPHLVFRSEGQQVIVDINPLVREEVEAEARKTRNMFLFEGLFFMALLGAGSVILVLSWRSENRFVQARELFLAGAAHEFKTPLASLKLYTETLGREGLKEDDRQLIRDHMGQDIGRLERLVNEVLSMSAADAFTLAPSSRLDLVAETRQVLRELAGFIRENDSVLEFQHDDGVFMEGLRVPFCLALRNLIVNAVTHSPEGVSILVTLQKQGKWHHLTVKDNGPGIPRRLHGRIFDCFFSGNREGKAAAGTGLGLYLVKRNVETLGGRVEMESEEGKGSSFTLVLPVGNMKEKRK